MMLAELTLTDLLDRFASSDPTPGGGSAAAMAGALGASLLAMVAGMPKTRTGTPDERAALDTARAELLRHRDTLLDLVDRDAQSYDLVVAAYRHPKGTDEEKAARKAAIQQAMLVATETPLETMRVCAAAMTAGRAAAEFGNPSAMSDAGVGMVLLSNGMQAAALNVAINLDGLADPAYQKATAENVLELMRGIHAAASRGTAGGFGQLWGALTKHAGYPPPPSPAEHASRLAVEGLRQMQSAVATQALELLAASDDEIVSRHARKALEGGVTS